MSKVYHINAVVTYDGNLSDDEFEQQIMYMLDCMPGITKRVVMAEPHQNCIDVLFKDAYSKHEKDNNL
jgi:hypothetical protein